MLRKTKEIIRRFDLYYANLSPVIGSEQGGIRPVIIIQNDIGNYRSPTVIVSPLTAKGYKTPLPTHVLIPKKTGLKKYSFALLEQIKTIDKSRLLHYIGRVNDYETKNQINNAIAVSLGL